MKVPSPTQFQKWARDLAKPRPKADTSRRSTPTKVRTQVEAALIFAYVAYFLQMRYLIILAAVIGLACGQGFFSNIFGGGGQRRPPQQQQRPQQAFRPQQQFRQPQPNNFARPAQQRPQTFNRPRPQQQFNQRPQNTFVQQQSLRSAPINTVGSNANSVVASTSGCPMKTSNHVYANRNYIVTFFDESDACNTFTASEADNFCKSVGGRAVSLDSNEKALAMMDLLRQKAKRFMWTGGRIDHASGVVTWPSGAREGYNRGQRFWSHTGS